MSLASLDSEVAGCFPAEGPIHSYVQWAHRLTHAPAITHVAAITPLLGYELCRRGFTLPGYGTPRVWFGLIAPPAVGKTTVLGWAQDFTRDWYAEHFEHEAITPRPWVSLEGSLPGVLQAIASMGDPFSQTTCGILFHTEFSKVLRADDALEPLNMIYDGRDYERNLRYLQKAAEQGVTSQPKAVIKGPAFSALATTTPSAFSRVCRAETLEGGLFSRFMWLREKLSRDSLQFEPAEDPVGRRWALGAWSNWFGRMEALRLEGLSPTIAFDEAGREWLKTVLFDSLRDSMVRENYEASIAVRVLPHTSRLAAIYAASRASVYKGQVYVTLDDIMRAANMTIRCMRDALALAGEVAIGTMNLTERQRVVLDAITRAGETGIVRRQLYAITGGHVDKGQLDLIMASLEDAGLIVEEVASGPAGGRPARRAYTVEAWRRKNDLVDG